MKTLITNMSFILLIAFQITGNVQLEAQQPIIGKGELQGAIILPGGGVLPGGVIFPWDPDGPTLPWNPGTGTTICDLAPYTPYCHCSNGVQDYGETGVDCGGSCDDCESDSCSNGIMDNGETGVDCGGPCDDCEPDPCDQTPYLPECHCNDGIQNYGERGIDCGGTCPNTCPCTLNAQDLVGYYYYGCTFVVDVPGYGFGHSCPGSCGVSSVTYSWSGGITSNEDILIIEESGTYDITLTLSTSDECGSTTSTVSGTFEIDLEDCFGNNGNSGAFLQSNNNSNTFAIYPNPVQKQFTLNYELPNTETKGLLNLMNAQGQQVLTQEIQGSYRKKQFNVADLPNGIYFLSVQSEGAMLYQSKVVINN